MPVQVPLEDRRGYWFTLQLELSDAGVGNQTQVFWKGSKFS